jgi:hypothetical protein
MFSIKENLEWKGGLKVTLSEINKRYEDIMFSNDSQQVKTTKLSNLMTEMEELFSIPMLRDDEWESENRKVIALYRKISKSRVFNNYLTGKINTNAPKRQKVIHCFVIIAAKIFLMVLKCVGEKTIM